MQNGVCLLLKKILSTIGVLLGVLLLLSGVLVLLLSNTAFFGTAVTWVLCGCVAVLMLFVIYIAVTRIIDALGKRQSDEEIIEEQHLKNIFTNEIALKQQTISMTAINPAIQQTAHNLDKTAILRAQKEAELAKKESGNKLPWASRAKRGKKADDTVQNEIVENIYRTTTMDAQVSPLHSEQEPRVAQEPSLQQETSANIWDQMEIKQSGVSENVYTTSGKLPITGPTPAQKAAAQRFQADDFAVGASLFNEAEVQDAKPDAEKELTKAMPMPTRVTSRRVTRPPLNRQKRVLQESFHSLAEEGTESISTSAQLASSTDDSIVRAEYEGSKENTRVTRRPVSRRTVAPAPVVSTEVAKVVEQEVSENEKNVETSVEPSVSAPATKVTVASEKPKTPPTNVMPEQEITSSLAKEKALALEKTVAEITAVVEGSTTAVEEAPKEPVKRGRGRPKKVKTPEELAAEAAAAEEPKRRPGRPPKELTPEDIAAMNAPKRPRGRPAKVLTAEEIAAMNAPKRPRGRPKKVETEEAAIAETE